MAHKTTERRRKLKLEDPEKYQLYLEESRKRNKKNRDKLKQALQKKKPDAEDVEKKEHILALQKIRQKKYLEKKQTNEKLVVKLTDCLPKNKKTKQPQPKPKTRHAIQERREYNRKKKQEERAKQSYQKKMWNRKKDRERKQRKRAELSKSPKSTETSSPSASHVEETGFTSKKTEWNTTSKVRKQLPQTPKKFAKVVTNLVENATPRKRKAIEQLKNKSKKPRLTRTVKELPRKETSKTRCARFIIKRSLKRRSRIDVLGIQKFYMREDISQVLPNKRFATKDGPGYIMQVPIRVAHAKYLNENPSNRVSIGKFASLRKKNVRKLTKTHRNYCCCVFCMNIRFKLLTLSRSVTQTSKKKVNECDLQEITLCPKGHNERFHDPACINGTCEKCNDYKKTLDEFYSSVDANKQLNWSRWEKVKGKDGKEKRIVVTKRGNKDDLLTELVENDIQNPAQGTQFFQHLFNAKWQQLQFQHAKMDIADDAVVQVMDFARNREIKYQDEIKATYYTASQVTMHPIVNFYKTETGLMRESCIVISEDCKHDFHAVHHFENIVKEHLTEEMGQPPNRYIIFSDGCSAQYKSKGPFADLSLVATDTNRNFFGSEHGKNECDGEIGVVNQAIDRAIIGNKVVINNAEEMFQFCKANLETNEVLSKRTFFFVKENEIERDRPETNVKTVPNTRKLHQINNCHLKNSLRTRNLSCFCRSCESWNYADCLNSKYVGAYEVKQLQIERKEKKRNVPDQSKTDNSNEAETTGQRQNPNIPVTEENETHILDQTNIDTPDKTETMGQRQNLNIPVPEESASDEDERSTFFASKLQLFSECNNYQELERKVFDSVNDVKHKFGEADIDTTVCIVDNKLTADAVAQSIMDSYPNDCPDDLQGRLPVVVNGDGNCLPRTASVLAFGNEQRYTEMRCRIIIELIENKETYLSIDHLNKCIDLPGNESASLLKTYCMFSEKYIPGTRTTRKAITKVFEEEVVAICVDKAYMGIWQLFAVSSVLHCKIFSVYPALGSALYQMTMNRLIPPIDDRHKESLGCVVWTSTRNDMTARNWLPNHFVPLVPIENFRPTHVEVIELFDDSDVMETSVDSALMEGIIENLCQSPEASFSEISTRYVNTQGSYRLQFAENFQLILFRMSLLIICLVHVIKKLICPAEQNNSEGQINILITWTNQMINK